MANGGEISREIGGTIDRLHQQLDTSVSRSVDLHRSGGNEEAVLAETAVAVGAAQALEILTGESLEEQLARREAHADTPPPAPARRWRRARPDQEP